MSASGPSGPLVSFFFEGGEDPNTIKSGPMLAASETPFKWHFPDGPMMAQHNTLNAGLKAL